MLNQVFPVKRTAHALPLLIGDRPRCDVSILCLIDQVHRALILAHIKFLIGIGQACHSLWPEQTQHGVEHRQPNVLTLPGFFSGVERGTDSLCRRNRGYFVGNNDAKHLRATCRAVSLDIGSTGERLDNRVVHPLVSIGALLAKTVDRDINELLIELAQHRLTEPHAIHCPGPEVLQQHISALDEIK